MSNWPDLVNGSLEFAGGFFLWKNVIQLYKDKAVMGVHWAPTLFFFIWGMWNLFYYPHLGQWFSFVGGINIAIANGIWFALMWKYKNKGKDGK